GLAAVGFAAAKFLHHEFWPAADAGHGGRDERSAYGRRSQLQLRAVAVGDDLLEPERIARRNVAIIDLQLLPFDDLILPAAVHDNCVHGSIPARNEDPHPNPLPEGEGA